MVPPLALWIFSFQVFGILERVCKSMWIFAVWWLVSALFMLLRFREDFCHIVEDLQLHPSRGGNPWSADVSTHSCKCLISWLRGGVWMSNNHGICLFCWVCSVSELVGNSEPINSYESMEVPTVMKKMLVFSRKYIDRTNCGGFIALLVYTWKFKFEKAHDLPNYL